MEVITEAVLEQLVVSCTDCAITSDVIERQSFACYDDSPTSVTYRARVSGTSETDSGSLISLIEKWLSGGVSIIVNGIIITVDSDCSVAISSLSEGECSPTPPPTTPPTNDTNMTTTDNTSTTNTAASSTDTGAIIGGVVAMVFIISVTFAIAAIIITLIVRNRHRSVSLSKHRQ